jgi:hypothetical protein
VEHRFQRPHHGDRVQASWDDGELSPGEVATIDCVATGAPAMPTHATLNGAPTVFGSPSPAPRAVLRCPSLAIAAAAHRDLATGARARRRCTARSGE